MDITITTANSSDSKKCCELAYTALKEYAHEMTLIDDKKTTLERLETFFNHSLKSNIHKSNFIVAKINNNIVGSCTCYKGSLTTTYNKNLPKINAKLHVDKQKLQNQVKVMEYTREAKDNEYYLDTIAVDENYKGLGIAKKLIQSAKEKAKTEGFNTMVIVVNKSHLFKFYENLGFKKYKHVTLCGINYNKMYIEF